MPSDNSKHSAKSNKSNTTPASDRPIRTDEDITAAEEALANDISNQASYQARPFTEDPLRARAHETETGRRADVAAGIEPHSDQLADSEKAFKESRGSREPRTPPGR
jgi:hypothetical protein